MATEGMSVTVQGLPELIAKLKQLGESFSENGLRLAVTAGALPIQNAAKQNAPKKHRILADSIHTEVIEADDNHAVAEIGTNVVYAAIQEFGGTITPKTAKMLHWVDDDGNDIFAHSVTIPAHPYLRPALAEHQADAISAINNVLRQYINQVAP